MGVDVPVGVGLAVGGGLVEAHGVWEADVEEVVVAGGEAGNDVGEGGFVVGGHLVHGGYGADGGDDGFEGPFCPEGDEGDPEIVFADDALVEAELGFEVIGEEGLSMGGEVGFLVGVFAGDFGGNCGGGPDLAVGVGIAAAHELAFVFKNLDVVDVIEVAEVAVLFAPGVDDGEDLVGGHFGEGEVLAGGEADYEAEYALGLGLEEVVWIFEGGGGIGEQGGEIVVENEG